MPSSWFYHNYPKTAAKLTKFFFVILIVSVIAGLFISNKTAKAELDQLVFVKGTLQGKPELGESSNSKTCFYVFLHEFPQKKFTFGEPACKFSKTKEFLRIAKGGDTVLMEVANIDKSDTASLDAFSLTSNQIEYFTSKDYIDKQTEDQSLLWVFIIIAVVLLIVYAILEFTGVIDRFTKWFEKSQTSLADYRKSPQIRDFNELDMH